MKPQDVAMYRREQLDWLQKSGQRFFEQAILLETQTLYPTTTSDALSAAALVEAEVDRLSNADMWFIDGDTCDLVSSAYGNMPAFQPQRHDLPSKNGFVMFDRPLMAKELQIDAESFYEGGVIVLLKDLGVMPDGIHMDDVNGLQEFTNLIMEDTESALKLMHISRDEKAYVRSYIDRARKIKNLDQGIMQIGAMSWSDHYLGTKYGDGTWVTFYALTAVQNKSGTKVVENITPLHMIIEGETFIRWEDGLHVGGREESRDWFRMLLATFRIATQKNLCEKTTERTSRSERRRCQRDGVGCSDIRVIRLRSSHRSANPGSGAGKEYSCRWRVSGHWRQQWYPSVEDHRPIWIMDHIKGPNDKPFRGGERVKVV